MGHEFGETDQNQYLETFLHVLDPHKYLSSDPQWELLFSHSVRLFAIPWTVAHQAPLSVGFSRQEYWNGLSFPPPVDLPDPEIELVSLASPALAGGFFTS